jgi:hypothetical protein
MTKIIATGLLLFHNQVILSPLNVNAAAKSTHIIVEDINRFLFFILLFLMIRKANLIDALKEYYFCNLTSRKTSRKPHAETTKDPRFNVSP